MRAAPAILFVFPIVLHPIPFQFNPVQSSLCRERSLKSLEKELTEKCIKFTNNEKWKTCPSSSQAGYLTRTASGPVTSLLPNHTPHVLV